MLQVLTVAMSVALRKVLGMPAGAGACCAFNAGENSPGLVRWSDSGRRRPRQKMPGKARKPAYRVLIPAYVLCRTLRGYQGCPFQPPCSKYRRSCPSRPHVCFARGARLGLDTSTTMGGFIHVLLVIAIVVVLLRLISGRRHCRRSRAAWRPEIRNSWRVWYPSLRIYSCKCSMAYRAFHPDSGTW